MGTPARATAVCDDRRLVGVAATCQIAGEQQDVGLVGERAETFSQSGGRLVVGAGMDVPHRGDADAAGLNQDPRPPRARGSG